MQRDDLKILAAQSKDRLDAAIQTDVLERSDESCQTDTAEGKDFQVQACIRQQSEPIAIQTDTSPKCDFQVQANIPRENHSIAVQTIKEEIAMPNLPSSTAQTPAKKRKMSSATTPNGSGDRLNEEQPAVDNAILNSEVYKIYSRNENTKEAMEQIKKLKNCISFTKPAKPFPTKDLKQSFEKVLDNLWKVKPECGVSKFARIKKYIERKPKRYYIDELDYETCMIFRDCYTKIVLVNPNGYEYWYVANFEKGPSISKWYRGESNNWIVAMGLAQLNVMGITKATIKKLQFDHYMEQKSQKISWLEFALAMVENDLGSLIGWSTPSSYTFDVEEIKTDSTIEVNACFHLTIHPSRCNDNKILKKRAYHGRSTRPKDSLQKTGPSKNEKEMMEKEAKKAALMEFFKEHFGFTEFNDLCMDELHRPMEI